MKALQYIFTSWKNGSSRDKGYMVYSKSEGITEEESADIKSMMQYKAPASMNPTPTPEEIRRDFPVNFAYFRLHSGRVCIAQSTYLGRDYSSRFGNYIIYALVCGEDELDVYPAECFGEDYIKTFMTEEELNAESPVPPLPEIDITTSGSVLSEEVLTDFVGSNLDAVKYFISAALEARKERIPLYLNDTRENLVLWCAVLTRLFPLSVAKKIYFSTYVADPESVRHTDSDDRQLVLDLQGVRSDLATFSYKAAKDSTNQIVMDMENGIITEDVQITDMALELTDDYTMGMSEISDFDDFLDQSGYAEYDSGLSAAFDHYRIQKLKQYSYEEGKLKPLLEFGQKYLTEECNKETAVSLLGLMKSSMETVGKDDAAALIFYLYRYAGFMAYSIHSMLIDLMSRLAEEDVPHDRIFALLDKVKEAAPDAYSDLITYFASGDVQSEQQLYLSGNPDVPLNLFLAKFILREYWGKSETYPKVEKLFLTVLDNLAAGQKPEESCTELLDFCENLPDAAHYILRAYSKQDSRKMVPLAEHISDWMNQREGKEASRKVLPSLLEDPLTAKLGVGIYSIYLRMAKDKDRVFWDFYEDWAIDMGKDKATDIDAILDAYLDGGISPVQAEKLISRVDEQVLATYPGLPAVLRSLDAADLKTLIGMKNTVCALVKKLAVSAGLQKDCPRILSVFQSRLVFAHPEIKVADFEKSRMLSVAYFERKEYRLFLENYLGAYMKIVRDEYDMASVIFLLCKKSEEDSFYSMMGDFLKAESRTSRDLWRTHLTDIALSIIRNPNVTVLADYRTPFFRYLKKLEEDDFRAVEEAAMKQAGKNLEPEKVKLFFERSQEKESFMDRLFRRK